MTIREKVIYRYDSLPAHQQEQVLHFIENLSEEVQTESADGDYQAKLVQALKARKAAYAANPVTIPSEEAEQKLMDRFGWSE